MSLPVTGADLDTQQRMGLELTAATTKVAEVSQLLVSEREEHARLKVAFEARNDDLIKVNENARAMVHELHGQMSLEVDAIRVQAQHVKSAQARQAQASSSQEIEDTWKISSAP